MSGLFKELRRRNVYKTAVAYTIVGWLLVEIASLVFDAFHFPDWTIQFFISLIVLGFPVAVLLAWAFELTADGIQRTADVPPGQSVTHSTGRKLDFAIIGLLSAVVIYFAFTHDWSGNDTTAPQALDESTAAGSEDAATDGPKSIAVLPFANLSDNAENAFFASGVHEDILTYLSRVSNLRVISRTSVLKYQDDQSDIPAIAKALGVDHVVEGSVRRSGNRVRVTAQLIDAKSDHHLWADNYDRELTDIFAIQTEVARAIVDSLQASLTPGEEKQIDTQLTNSVEAYDAFVIARDRDNQADYSLEKHQFSSEGYKRATDLDPEFALAWARYAMTMTAMAWVSVDNNRTLARDAKNAIDTAFALQPDLPEARLALADYHYRINRDFNAALAQLEIAHAASPSNSDVLEAMGLTQRRLGLFDESVESFRMVGVLDPDNLGTVRLLVVTLSGANRYDDAISTSEKYLAVHDYNSEIDVARGLAYLDRDLDVKVLAEAVKQIPADSTNVDSLLARMLVPWYHRDYPAALDVLDIPAVANTWSQDGFGGWDKLWRVKILIQLGRKDEAQEILADALKDASWFEPDPNTIGNNAQWSRLVTGARLYAIQGQCDKALALADKARDLFLIQNDALVGSQVIKFSSIVFASCGRVDQMLDDLENHLGKSWTFGRRFFALDPEWDFMRDNPRFREIVGIED